MAARWLPATALLSLLALLGAGARQEPEKEEKLPPEEPPGKVVPTPNAGGHTGGVEDMAFSPDGKRLYTAGRPGEVAEWDVESGKRLRVWRFARAVKHLAISTDGKQLAAAGPSPLADAAKTAVWLIDLAGGDARLGPVVPTATRAKAAPKKAKQIAFAEKREACEGVAFSADGKRLAVCTGYATEVHALQGDARPVVIPGTLEVRSLALDRSGRWLLMGRNHTGTSGGAGVLAIDIAAMEKVAKGRAGNQVRISDTDKEDARAAWSADGKRVVAVTGTRRPSVRVWSFDGSAKLQWQMDRDRLLGVLGEKLDFYQPAVLAFLSDHEIVAGWVRSRSLHLVRIDLNKEDKDRVERLPTAIKHQDSLFVRSAVSADGRLLAITSDPASQVVLYDLKEHKEVGKLGPPVRVPQVVYWSAEGHRIAWGDRPPGPGESWKKAVTHTLDLDALEQLESKPFEAAKGKGLPAGWKVVGGGKANGHLVKSPKKSPPIYFRGIVGGLARSYKTARGEIRVVVVHHDGHRISIIHEGGKAVAHLPTVFDPVYDLAVSADDRYLLVAGGDQTLEVYALDSPSKPLLRVIGSGRDWVVWTEPGYYAGTPGGEKLFGWKVTTDERRQATFFPAERFRKKHYRPDLIRQVLEAGSVEAALGKAPGQERAVTVAELLPPQVRLSVQRDPKDEQTYLVEASAESSSAGQPVEGLRLLVDGRPLPDGVGVLVLGSRYRKVSARWAVKVPSGAHELKALARCADVSGISEPHNVRVPVAAAERPALHLVSVGLDYADDKGLKLGCTNNDAQAIEKAFTSDACVGAKNLFARASARTLLNKEASRAKLLDALDEAKKSKLRPQDLVVLFYAGHGVREGKEFYLLTHGANLDNLGMTALSGSELRMKLKDFPCQVLLLLDACHSGESARALRGLKPATDDASRELADEECGVTLLAAAMGHEKALEPKDGKHGLFTQALLKALQKGNAVTHNRRDGRQYVHHLFVDVLDEVQAESGDRQHPFLSLPWTIESFPLRKVR